MITLHMKTKNLCHQVNSGVVALLAASTLPFGGQVVAQDELIEEVIVTGSRISRDFLEKCLLLVE